MLTVIIVILVIALCGGVLVSLNNTVSTDGFVVLYGEERIMEDTSGLFFDGITTIEVQQYLDGKKDIDVRIYAIGNAENDFMFTMDGVTYKWSQTLAGKDVTAYVLSSVAQPSETDGNARVTVAGDIYQVLTKYSEEHFNGKTVEIPEENIPAGDMFRMVITVGKTTRTLNFFKDAVVTGIEIKPGQIIF